MSLTALLRTDLIDIRSDIKNKRDLLSAIADLSCTREALARIGRDSILKALQAREELGTTGFGKGIAIPHCRVPGLEEFILGIIQLPEQIEFDTLDGKPISLAVFLITPETESNKHIRLLSSISQVLRIPGAIEEIMAQTSQESIKDSFLRFASDDLDEQTHESKNLFHLVIRNEDIFHEILPLFSALKGSIEYVLEAKHPNDYAAKIPLFAGILNDEFLSFCRVIVATVEKRMTNDTIRRIESITGALDNNSEVMLIVQDVIYASGKPND